MPKRIVICFDGTWNMPDEQFVGLNALHEWYLRLRGLDREEMRRALLSVDAGSGAVETNVCRFYRSVVERPNPGGGQMAQVKWYDAGVGTKWYERIVGGAFGLGLSLNLREGYHALAEAYEDGDQVFILGFSRGAYTARSLVGMIRNSGLLPKGAVADGPQGDLLMEAYEIYRTRDGDADNERARAFRRLRGSRIIDIAFLGVWDTVGALGIPLKSFAGFNRDLFKFHDTELSGIVRNAVHAIAVDEHREPYAVTMWDPLLKDNQRMEQRWFVGAHCDIGGGYESRMLSDMTLAWMQAKAQAAGLELHPEAIPVITDSHPDGPLHDSFANFMKGGFQFLHDRFYRPMRRSRNGQEAVDGSVHLRLRRDAEYRPRNPGLHDP
jgi:uncharacterized protein (DUF2235 family)